MSPKTLLGNYRPHLRVQLDTGRDSLVQQASRAETDINFIMKKFEKTGVIEHLNQHNGEYGDFIGVTDYQTALDQVAAATEAFASIPSKIRAEFSNDAQKFLAFAQDPQNIDRMVELGLARRSSDAAPTPTPNPEGQLTLEEAPATPA
jgi:phage internal scaffolding protein